MLENPNRRNDANPEIPYALLYVAGSQVALTKEQFEQASRDGRLCRCKACLACTAWGHALANQYRAYRGT